MEGEGGTEMSEPFFSKAHHNGEETFYLAKTHKKKKKYGKRKEPYVHTLKERKNLLKRVHTGIQGITAGNCSRTEGLN